MAKHKLDNRLEELFSHIAVEAIPEAAPVSENGGQEGEGLPMVPGIDSADALAGLLNAEELRSEEAPHPEETLPSPQPEDEAGPLARPLAGEQRWGEFFDGIHRKERIGYVFDASGLRELDGEGAPEQAEMRVPIRVSGHEVGELFLQGSGFTQQDRELIAALSQQVGQQIDSLRLLDEAQRAQSSAEEALLRLAKQGGRAEELLPDSARPVLSEQMDLVRTVAQRLGRQIENLRLLDDARRFQKETEGAIRAITFQSWQSYLTGVSSDQLGFQYAGDQVVQLDPFTEACGKAFPLKIRGEVIGQLSLEAETAVSEDARSLVRLIGERLSAHLDGLRLGEQREQALSETELLYSISAQLSAAQSIEEALATVSLPAEKTGAADSRLFFVNYDDRGQVDSLNLAAVWYPDEGAQLIPVKATFPLADYPAYGICLADPDCPVLMENIAVDPRLDEAGLELFQKTGAVAIAMLPLAIKNRWVGIIFIHWPDPRIFSPQERRLYSALSRQAAVVVNNRLLLEQTRKRAQELQTVAQVSTAASTILDPVDLLQSVVDLTKSSFSLYHVQVYLFRAGERILEVAAGSGEAGQIIAAQKQYEVWESLSPVARAARERQVVIVADTLNSPFARQNVLLPETRSAIAVPMVVGERLMGVFEALSDQINRFSREDARAFTTLAMQVSVALQNAELYSEQTATVERLRELDHLKSSFLANMSHELRTPLNSILGFADVILLGLDGKLTELMDSDIRLIQRNGKHLLSLINDVLDMAKIEAGRMSLSMDHFLLHELLGETVDITSSLAREKDLYLEIAPGLPERVEIVADRVRIRQVLINVISNAVKFTEKGGITITASISEGNVLIGVKDTGLGIPSSKLEMIFDEFSQVDTSSTRKAGGTGLGLPISRRLVELHGGRMWAESLGIAGEGSTFFIELPLQLAKSSSS